jgi:hypothetical protein
VHVIPVASAVICGSCGYGAAAYCGC